MEQCDMLPNIRIIIMLVYWPEPKGRMGTIVDEVLVRVTRRAPTICPPLGSNSLVLELL